MITQFLWIKICYDNIEMKTMDYMFSIVLWVLHPGIVNITSPTLPYPLVRFFLSISSS